MGAMMALNDVDGVYPMLSSFLEFLVSEEIVSEPRLKGMLAATSQPSALLPSDGAEGWPTDLEVPGTARGEVDGLSDPAPSGGPARPETGFDAVRAYRFNLVEPGQLTIRLTIAGSGRLSDHQDLDLDLRDIRARQIAVSRSEAPVERLVQRLPAGWYIVYVRDGGGGNRAGYELSIALQ
jgi:hypothetical protein